MVDSGSFQKRVFFCVCNDSIPRSRNNPDLLKTVIEDRMLLWTCPSYEGRAQMLAEIRKSATFLLQIENLFYTFETGQDSVKRCTRLDWNEHGLEANKRESSLHRTFVPVQPCLTWVGFFLWFTNLDGDCQKLEPRKSHGLSRSKF